MEQRVELHLHITVLVNEKYTLDLIFKRGKSAILRSEDWGRFFSFGFGDPLTITPESQEPFTPLAFSFFDPVYRVTVSFYAVLYPIGKRTH